jgi:hypothetical protein
MSVGKSLRGCIIYDMRHILLICFLFVSHCTIFANEEPSVEKILALSELQTRVNVLLNSNPRVGDITPLEVDEVLTALKSYESDSSKEHFSKVVQKLEAIRKVAGISGLKRPLIDLDSEARRYSMKPPSKREILEQSKRAKSKLEGTGTLAWDLFPGLDVHTAAIECGVFDSAGKSVRVLLNGSGYPEADIAAFEAFEQEFGNSLPGSTCVDGRRKLGQSDTFDSNLDGILKEIDLKIANESEDSKKNRWRKMVFALKGLARRFKMQNEREKEQRSELTRKAKSLPSWGREHLGNLDGVLGFQSVCNPCLARHRNDLLLFLAGKREHGFYMEMVARVAKEAELLTEPHSQKAGQVKPRRPGSHSPVRH